VPEIDPAARPLRRKFSAEYKQMILAEYEAAPEGEKGSVLRREGLYSSQITEWRLARDAGALGALEPGTRQRKRSAAEVELEKLKRKHERTEAELARTRLALDIMGKASALLESLDKRSPK
jgi:transposase-like protein